MDALPAWLLDPRALLTALVSIAALLLFVLRRVYRQPHVGALPRVVLGLAAAIWVPETWRDYLTAAAAAVLILIGSGSIIAMLLTGLACYGLAWLVPGGASVLILLILVVSAAFVLRGALRHLYEFKFNLEFKLSTEATSAGGEGEGGEEEGGEEEGAASAKVPKVTSSTVCKGTLEYHDVMPAKEGGVVDIGNVAQSFKSQPKDKPPAVAAVEALKRAVLQTLADFDADFRASKKV